MMSSAIFMGVLGVLFLFAPEEIGRFLGMKTGPMAEVFFQLLSALYLGFGMLNWLSRDALIGGIYKRPVVLANLMHFWVGAVTLIKVAVKTSWQSVELWVLAIFYSVFAALFFIVFRNNPKEVGNTRDSI